MIKGDIRTKDNGQLKFFLLFLFLFCHLYSQADTTSLVTPTTPRDSAIELRPLNRSDAIDSFRIAGVLLGVNLYWRRNDILDRIVGDTLGWPEILFRFLGVKSFSGNSPSSSVSIALERGKHFIKLRNASAISVAIIADLGYSLFFLTQWSGTIDLPKGYEDDTKIQRQNILSHFLWESLDSVEVEKPTRFVSDYRVRIFFKNGGCSHYMGKEDIVLSRAQILATSGFSLREKVQGFIPEQNLYRMVVSVYLLCDADVKPPKITSEIEKIMDSLKLDMSYKAPAMNVVK